MIELDHIAIAVNSIDQAMLIYRALGGSCGIRETVVEQGIEALPIDLRGTRIELLQPLSPNSPVGKFLAKRGEGLHHIAWRVESIEATLEELAGAGIMPIDAVPREGAGGKLIVFLDPKTTGGVLIELSQHSSDESNLKTFPG